MERIIIDVQAATAAKWRTASFQLKREIGSLMDKQISTIMDKREEKDILPFLNELRAEMMEKGLTQDILDDILKDEQ
jgi:hypothetical protein